MRLRNCAPVTWAVLFSLWSTVGRGAEPVRPANRGELTVRLHQALQTSAAPGAHWGVKAVSLQTGRTLFETNAGRLFVPASNTKLFTGALALDRLGTNRVLTTGLFIPAGSQGPEIKGDLLVVGGGDPTLTDRLNGGRWEPALAPFVAAVTNAGIRQIGGDLVCDHSLFRGAPYGSGWNWDDLGFYYGAAVSALSVNDNVLHLRATPGKTVGAPATLRLEPLPAFLELTGNVRTGPTNATANLRVERLPGETQVRVSGVIPLGGGAQTEDVTVPAPATYFGELLRLALKDAGVTVGGKVREVGWRDRAERPFNANEWKSLAAISSPPMTEVVAAMMKPSQNFYAHSLWLLAGVQAERLPVGKEVGLPRPETTEDSGLRALRTFLGTAGIGAQEVVFEEGSGLSRKNLVTPAALVQLLVHMNRHPARAAWREALPVGGVEGTLKRRFASAEMKGRVHAKTGTLRHVSALSGYVDTKGGETVAFSVMVNGYVPAKAGATPTAETDRLVELLAGFTGRSDAE
jgi:D-alanyl-D-alanine carboxypeptidase/D-alanyl-D-alanine-endopeptidase (penicillin-binding protein 4)